MYFTLLTSQLMSLCGYFWMDQGNSIYSHSKLTKGWKLRYSYVTEESTLETKGNIKRRQRFESDSMSCASESAHLSGHSQRTASTPSSLAVHSSKVAGTASSHHTSELVSYIYRTGY